YLMRILTLFTEKNWLLKSCLICLLLIYFFVSCNSQKNSDENKKEISISNNTNIENKDVHLSNSLNNSSQINEKTSNILESEEQVCKELYIKFPKNIKEFYRLLNKSSKILEKNSESTSLNSFEKNSSENLCIDENVENHDIVKLVDNMKKKVYPLFFYIEFSKISSLPENYQSFFNEEKKYFSIPSIILDSRHILANYSLLRDASVWFIKDEESDVYLKIKGVDEEFNIALFEAERDLIGVNYISFEKISESYLPGELFYSINHAHQLEHSFFKFFVEAYYYSPFYETISTFFSRSVSDFSHAGSIIFDKNGDFGGVVTLFDAYYKNSGMIVSAKIVKKIVEKLQKGYFIKNEAWIGFTIEQKKDYLQIKNIVPESPAFKAKLKESDIIISINNKIIKTKKDLFNIIQFVQPGNRLQIEIFRDNKKLTKSVMAEVKPADQLKNSSPEDSVVKGRILGISLFDEEGKICISNIEDGSVAFFYEFKKGDCILKINDFNINSKEDFSHFFENKINKGETIQFLILRNGKKHYIGMKKP
ncbi:PDZ domain-containing protein, partial [bacterium]|nr:PDZ domain-containing protein [bacterium]